METQPTFKKKKEPPKHIQHDGFFAILALVIERRFGDKPSTGRIIDLRKDQRGIKEKEERRVTLGILLVDLCLLADGLTASR